MVIPAIIGSLFLDKRNPYYMAFQQPAVTFPPGTTISFLPLEIISESVFYPFEVYPYPHPLIGIM